MADFGQRHSDFYGDPRCEDCQYMYDDCWCDFWDEEAQPDDLVCDEFVEQR